MSGLGLFRSARFLALSVALGLGLLTGCGSSDPAPRPTLDAQSDAADGGADAPDSAADADGAGGDVSADADAAGSDDWVWPGPTGPIEVTPHESWRNTLSLPYDAFLRSDESQNGGTWVKFLILTGDPTKVYFQNSWTYPLHQPFATQRITPFVGLTAAQFDALTLHAAGQKAVLGALLVTPQTGGREYALQLVREDAYPKHQVKAVFALVAAALETQGESWKQLYFPTWQQQEQAKQDAPWLAQHGIEVSSPARWAKGTTCYASGWTLGKLVEVPGDKLEAAYAAGSLTANDIVLTDHVPAEVPPVRAILSTEPGTANSHVAVLAHNLGLPYVWLAAEADKAKAKSYVGQQILLRAVQPDNPWYTCQLDLWPASQLNDTNAKLLQELKSPPPLQIAPMQTADAVVLPASELTPTSLPLVGGKAANYGVLLKAIPEQVRPAKALSFDLWQHYLDQTLPEGAPHAGQTLRAAIAAELAPFGPQPQIPQLDAALATIRTLITTHAQFNEADKQAVLSGLGSFAPNKSLRFRSSTNVEDTETFTGAGLYDSYSGCLADDLDADAQGPSACDATEPEERSVFRAIRKVYASFYNRNAVLERLRRAVSEDQVGMAVLVHHSFPDEVELANGVATLQWKSLNESSVFSVAQTGANSVTNPDNTKLPEVRQLHWSQWSAEWSQWTQSGSTLLPLGDLVLDSESDYAKLANLLRKVAVLWSQSVKPNQPFTLEFEWKWVEGEGLIIKQVRPLVGAQLADHPPVLIGDTVTLCTFQGEYGDVLANWRGKSRWQLTAANRTLDAAGLALPLAVTATVQLRTNAGVWQHAGPPQGWPGLQHVTMPTEQYPGGTAVTTSLTPVAGGPTWQLHAVIAANLPAAQAPILPLSDLQWTATLVYPTPVAALDWNNQVTTRKEDAVMLTVCPTPDHDPALPRNKRASVIAGHTLAMQMVWPKEPSGIVAGYTAPLLAWEGASVSGPLAATLGDWWSLSYRPGHHNFGEDFVLEPSLEPGADTSAWQAAGVRALLWQDNDFAPRLWRIATDGSLTEIQ